MSKYLTFFLIAIAMGFSVSTFSEGLEDRAGKFIEDLIDKVNFKVPLDEDEKKLLMIVGLEEDEVNNLNAEKLMDRDFRKKVSSHFNSFGKKKSKELEKVAKQEFIPGLATSTIGLGFASAFGMEAILSCRGVPSAMVFAGSSALWIGTEMMIWNGFKVKQKEIMELGNTKEFNKELKKITAKVKARWKVLKPKMKKFERFDDISVDSQVEGMDHVKAELDLLREDVRELVKAVGVLKEKQFLALDSAIEALENATSTTKKKARNAKLAGIGFTSAAALATAEAFNVFGMSYCGEGKFVSDLKRDILSFFIPSAHAAGIGLTDFDKIGIPVGAAAGYFIFRAMSGPKAVLPKTRAILYSAMAANALYASAKLDKSAKYIKEQEEDVKTFNRVFKKRINQIEGGLRQTDKIFNFLDKTIIPGIDHLLAEAQKLIDKGKDRVERAEQELLEAAVDAVTGESLENIEDRVADAKEQIEDVKDRADELEDEFKEGLNDAKDQIESMIEDEDVISELIEDAKESDLVQNFDLQDLLGTHIIREEKSMMDWILPQAHAALPGASCLRKTPNFVSVDRTCSCRSRGTCMEMKISWPGIKKEQESWMKPIMKSSVAHLKALEAFSKGDYLRAQKYMSFSERNFKSLDKVHKGLMKNLLKNSKQKPSMGKLVKAFQQPLKKSGDLYYQSNGQFAKHLKSPKKFRPPKAIASLEVLEEIEQEARSGVAFESDETQRSPSSEKSASHEKIENYVIEAIELDESTNLFEMISHRYVEKYFSQL